MGCVVESVSEPKTTVSLINIAVLGMRGVGTRQIINKYIHGLPHYEKGNLQKTMQKQKRVVLDLRDSNYIIKEDPSARILHCYATLYSTSTPSQYKSFLYQNYYRSNKNIFVYKIIFVYREGAEESLAEIENTWIPNTLKPYHYKQKNSCYLVEKCDNLKVKQDLDMSMKAVRLAKQHRMRWMRVDFKGENVSKMFQKVIRNIKCQKIEPKDMFISLLLGLNDNFEVSLIEDAIKLLVQMRDNGCSACFDLQ